MTKLTAKAWAATFTRTCTHTCTVKDHRFLDHRLVENHSDAAAYDAFWS
jgi:hypothetical protein